MRQYFLAGNWKMNFTKTESLSFVKELLASLDKTTNKVMIAPPFTSLDAVAGLLKGSSVILGAQNCSSEESGAFTGEVSPLMLKDLGVEVVILGHSERRAIFGESNELINKKLKLALKHGLEVILCVGETLSEREAGKTTEVCLSQLNAGLNQIDAEQLKKIVIAYEPVWAIGTGKTATPAMAEEVHVSLRKELAKNYGDSAAENVVIQYGGSVKADNVKELMKMENIDGALVGGASLKVGDFTAIVNFDK